MWTSECCTEIFLPPSARELSGLHGHAIHMTSSRRHQYKNENEYMYASMAQKKAITRYWLIHCYVRIVSLLLSSYVNVGMLHWNVFTSIRERAIRSPGARYSHDVIDDATNTRMKNEYMYATMARKKAITRYCLVHCYVRMASLLLSSYVNVGMLHWNFFTSIRERALRSPRARYSHDVTETLPSQIRNEYMYASMARKKTITRYCLIHCYVRIASLLLSSYVNHGILLWKFFTSVRERAIRSTRAGVPV